MATTTKKQTTTTPSTPSMASIGAITTPNAKGTSNTPSQKRLIAKGKLAAKMGSQAFTLKVRKAALAQNPKRPGSKAYNQFCVVQACNGYSLPTLATVWRKVFTARNQTNNGGNPHGELTWCINQGFVTLVPAANPKVATPATVAALAAKAYAAISQQANPAPVGYKAPAK